MCEVLRGARDEECTFCWRKRRRTRHIAEMDAFVYAMAHDTFGIAVVEALANGLPVIVNDWGVMREVTHDGEWRTLYRTADIKDCADAIMSLLKNIDNAKKKAKETIQIVRKAYSIGAHINRLYEVYRGL